MQFVPRFLRALILQFLAWCVGGVFLFFLLAYLMEVPTGKAFQSAGLSALMLWAVIGVPTALILAALQKITIPVRNEQEFEHGVEYLAGAMQLKLLDPASPVILLGQPRSLIGLMVVQCEFKTNEAQLTTMLLSSKKVREIFQRGMQAGEM